MDDKKKPYLASIIKKYKWLQEHDPEFYLHNLGEGIVKDELFQLVQVFEKLSEEDQIIVKNYIEIQDSSKLLTELNKKADSLSKNISRLLSGTTKDPQKRGLLNICALLLDIKPRPFDRNYDYTMVTLEKMSKPSRITEIQKNKKEEKSKFHFSVIVVLAIVAIAFFYTISIYVSQKNNTGGFPITINTENFTVSDIHRIFPDTATQFFDKQQQPIVWYTTYKDQPEFYNTAGIHPESGKQLKPINNQIIREYIVPKSYLKEEKSNTAEGTRVNNDATTSISLNTSIVNTTAYKELSVFMFDSISKLETDFTTQLTKQLQEEYVVTPQLIPTNQLSTKLKASLFQGDIKQLGNDVYRYTDYICVGKVIYEFKQNAILKTKQTCTLTINYTITDVRTGSVITTYSNSITSNGSTKDIAKRNTIKKFTL